MARRVHIVIAEPSVIIRSGLVSILKKLTSLNIDIAEISDISSLSVQLNKYKPDILIVDPSHIGVFSLKQIKNESSDVMLKTIALQNTLTDSATLKHYDDVISIYDGIDTIKTKLVDLMQNEDEPQRKQELTAREQEIVVCIVKGLTNKQIAEELHLSTYTIMAHRRNITTKLQIHSSAGLTIYAIVNKLVELNEIKDTIL